MEIANASVSPAIHIARALGVLSIEASLATSLACSLRWSTSCLTSAEELAGSPICVASASCCNSGMLGGVCARQSHHIAHPRYSAGKIKLRTSVTCCPCPDPARVLCCPRCTCSSLVLTHGLGAFSLVMPRRPLSGDLSIWYFDLLLGWRQVNKGLKNPFPPAS